jgi:WD40 repeat protein
VVRLASISALLLFALPLTAQPKVEAEAFAFEALPKTLEPARPYWWHVAASPDGRTFVTANAVEGGGEWWVWEATTGIVTDRVREPNVVRFVAFSPDGSLIATANFDNAVRVYDAKSRQLLAYGHSSSGGHSGGVNGLAFSRDGKRLATAGLDKTARVWDVDEAVRRARAAKGNSTVAMAPKVVCEGSIQSVYSVGLNADGSKLVTGGQDGSVYLWTVPPFKVGQMVRTTIDKATRLSGHGITVECVAVSPDGKRIASGSWDNTARLYDADGKDIATLRGHNRGVMALAFSPDSSLLATVSGDHTSPVAGEVRLWDATDGTDRGLLGRHDDMALGVAFGATGKTLVTVGRDRALREWDLDKRAERRALRPAGHTTDEPKVVQALAYSPDGTRLAVAGEGGEIAIWSVAERKRVANLVGQSDTVYALAWSKDGTLASGGGDKTVIVWDLAENKPRRTLKHPAAVYTVAISPDGKTIATGGFDKLVRFWDAGTGEEKGQREGHTASVRCLAFSPDGSEVASGGADYTVRRWRLTEKTASELRGHTRAVRSLAYLNSGQLVSGGDDGRLIVWNLADGDPVHSFGPYPDGVLSVAASPKGTFVVAGLGNGKVHVIDPAEEQTRSVLAGPSDATAAVAVSPDGRQVAAGGFDRTVRFWSAGTKPATPAVEYAVGGPARATAVAPNGELIAVGETDGVIRLFDARTGRASAQWPAHKGAVEDLAFSADGSALISGGADRQAIVWRPNTHEVLYRLTDHPGPVRRVALSSKGSFAATASTDGDVRVHDLAGGTVKKLNVEGSASALQFLSDDGLLAAGGPRAYLWDVREGRVADTLDGGQFARITGAAATADGKLIVLAGDPTAGSQLPSDVGNSRVLAVSRHHPMVVSQRLNDTGAGISRVSVSPDGRMVAVVGGDATVRAWEWPGVSPIRKFSSHAAAVLGLAVSRRGDFLVTASADGSARRWNASRGEPLVYAAKLLDESKQAWFARVSPDGKTLITGGDDKMLRVRDAVPGGFASLPGEFGCTYSAAISPDGTTLATGHFDGDIRIWDLKTRTQVKKLDGHAHRVWSLAFSPDGTRLVSGGGNWDDVVAGEIRIWDTATWKTVHEFAAHDDLVFQVAVSPDSKRIASCSRDQTVRTWDLATGKAEHVLRMHAGPVRTLAFTKDGKRLFSGGFDGRLQWWDPAAGTALDGRPLGVQAIERMRLSPDGKTLALALKTGNNAGYAALWDIEKSELLRKFAPHDGQVNDVEFSPDGRMLVSVGGRYEVDTRFEPGPVGPWTIPVSVTRSGKTTTRQAPASEIRLWDVSTGTPLAALPGHKHWVETVHFTPDGSRLITVGGVAGQPGEIRMSETAGLWPTAVLAASNGGLTCGKFSPDGSRFATGSTDGTLILWDLARALASDVSSEKVIAAHKGLVRNLAWTKDGSRLVTSGEDGVVKVWDTKTGDSVLTITAADRPVYGVAVSPNGTMIATAAGDWKNRKNGQVRVWDTIKGTELFRLPDVEAPAWGVAFTADGHLIVAQMGETAVRVFDIRSKKVVKTLTAAIEARGLSVSADGKRVAITAQANGLVKMWEAGTWQEAYEVAAHPGKAVFAIDVAADGQTMLTAGGDGAAVVWKVPGGSWKIPEYVPPAPRPVAQSVPPVIIDR